MSISSKVKVLISGAIAVVAVGEAVASGSGLLTEGALALQATRPKAQQPMTINCWIEGIFTC
jgi:hypothetical protein